MRVAFIVIAVEKHGDDALIKAEHPAAGYLHVRLDREAMEALGFQRVPVEQVKAGDKMIDIPIENGGQWKWAASKDSEGALVMPSVTVAVDVEVATPTPR